MTETRTAPRFVLEFWRDGASQIATAQQKKLRARDEASAVAEAERLTVCRREGNHCLVRYAEKREAARVGEPFIVAEWIEAYRAPLVRIDNGM